MTEIRHETPTGREGRPVPARNRWLRPALAAAAVATAVAVTLVALPSSDPGTPARPPSRSAVALLEDIALAAEHEKSYGTVRDDQFVYVESQVSYTHSGEGRRHRSIRRTGRRCGCRWTACTPAWCARRASGRTPSRRT